jgi:hypothetical protein
MSARKTSIPGIPAVTQNNLEDVARAVKDVIEVREGLKGDPLDAAVTFRDLTNSGIAGYVIQGRGAGAVSLIPPGAENDGYDPTKDLTIPPAPTNFIATGAFATIQLQWDAPPIRNYAYTEIWRSQNNVIGNAILIGTSSTLFYTDSIGTSATRYYWARHVSQANIFGPYNGTNGVVATTATDPALVLASLTNQITATQLYSDLGARINLIDAPNTTAGSVNARVKAVQDAANASIEAVQSQVNELINIPAYSASETYNANDQVTYNGSLYKAKSTTTGNLPTNTTYWTLIGNYTSLGDAVAAHTTQITNLGNNLATEISDRTTLYNQVNNPTTGLPATYSALTNNYYTKTATDLAISGQLTSYVTSTSLATQLGNYTNTSLLQDGYYSKTGTDNAITNRLTNYVSTTTLTSTLGSYSTVSNLQENYATKSDLTGATSSLSTTLTSAYQAADTTALNSAKSYTEVYAYAKSETYTKSTIDQAISSASTTLASSIGNNSTAIQTEATTRAAQTGELYAQYTVKVDTNGYVSGFGLASTSTSANPTSDFIVRADRFSIAAPTGPNSGITPSIPFVVNTSATTLNGVNVPAGVYIKDGFIQNGTITTAKIGNLAVDTANIAAGAIVEAKIGDGEITNAKIGNFIQSTNYSSGSTGWSINKNGNAEFSNAVVRGTIYASAGAIGGSVIESDKVKSSNYSAGVNGWMLNNDGTIYAQNINSGAYTWYAWPSSGGGFHTSRYGVLMGNYNAGHAYFQYWTNYDGNGPGRYFSFGSANGARYLNIDDGGISTNMNLNGCDGTFSGTLTASAVNAVNTININGDAVTIPRVVGGGFSGISSGAWRRGPYITITNAEVNKPIIVWLRVGSATLPFSGRSNLGFISRVNAFEPGQGDWESYNGTTVIYDGADGVAPYSVPIYSENGTPVGSNDYDGYRQQHLMMGLYYPQNSTVTFRAFAEADIGGGVLTVIQAKR